MRPEGSLLNPEPVAVLPPATVNVLDVPLGLTDYEGTLDWIDAMVAARTTRATSASATSMRVMASDEDPPLRGGRWNPRSTCLTASLSCGRSLPSATRSTTACTDPS